MLFNIVVSSSPCNQKSSLTAYNFVKAVIKTQHKVKSILFRDDGIYHSLTQTLNNDDNEPNSIQLWHTFAEKNNIKLIIPQIYAEKRFLVSEEYKNKAESCIHFVELSKWLESILDADRTIYFS